MCVRAYVCNSSSDTAAEHDLIKSAALKAGAFAAVVCTHWSDGGSGAVELAEAVINACKQPKNFKFLYNDEMSLLDKMNTVAQNMYGAAKVQLTSKAQRDMEKLTEAVSFCVAVLCSFYKNVFIILVGFWQNADLHV